MASNAVYLLHLVGRENAWERSECRYLALLVHPDIELRSYHLQLGDTDEDEHRRHRYRQVARALKHSGDPLASARLLRA